MKKLLLTILALCLFTFSVCAQSSKIAGGKTMGATINVTVKTDDYGGFGKLDITDVKEIKTFLAAGKGKTDIILTLK